MTLTRLLVFGEVYCTVAAASNLLLEEVFFLDVADK